MRSGECCYRWKFDLACPRSLFRDVNFVPPFGICRSAGHAFGVETHDDLSVVTDGNDTSANAMLLTGQDVGSSFVRRVASIGHASRHVIRHGIMESLVSSTGRRVQSIIE